MNQYIQTIFYHFILSDPGLTLKFDPSYFDAKNLQLCFKLAKEYVVKYHTAPTAAQLKELVQLENLSEELSSDVIDIIYSAKEKINEYTEDWLFDNATSWAQWKNFIASLRNTLSYVKLNENEVSVENVKEIMEHAKSMFNKSCILEFEEDEGNGSDFWDALSHKQRKLIRSSSGYPFIDLCLKGGWFPGCLVCFVGAPKSGKSLWLQNLCAASVKKGENNAYISLELPEEMIHSRIGANMFSIPALDYEKYTEDTVAFSEKLFNYKKQCLVPPGALIVKSFPTSTMSVLDLEAWLLAKEEELSTETKKFKFKNVFVDYINIMKNYRNPNTENTYMKIKQLAEDLKAVGIKHDWAMITATQTTRSQYDTADMLTSQVSESVGLGATVDAMFGIISTTIMKATGEYYLKCMYDRVAPEDNKRKRFTLDKMYLRIAEDPNSPIEDTALTTPEHSQSYKEFVRKNVVPNMQGSTSPQLEVKQQESIPIFQDTLNTSDTNPNNNAMSYINITGNKLF